MDGKLLGDVRFWHKADITTVLRNVRFRGQSEHCYRCLSAGCLLPTGLCGAPQIVGGVPDFLWRGGAKVAPTNQRSNPIGFASARARELAGRVFTARFRYASGNLVLASGDKRHENFIFLFILLNGGR